MTGAKVNISDRVLLDHYGCPEKLVHVGAWGNSSSKAGFFSFGSDAVCYARCSAFVPTHSPQLPLNDALEHVRIDQRGIELPFNIADAVSGLRYERYVETRNGAGGSNVLGRVKRAGYYAIRPLMPVPVRKHLQRYSLRDWKKEVFPRWPVDVSVESAIELAMRLNLKAQGLREIPFIWFWPDGAQACAVMTHDVETTAGRDFCDQLMDIDDSYGIKSSFQVIPERRYSVPETYLRKTKERGFEINVHDLNHDGRLFQDYDEFRRRSASINRYGKAFGTRGFRSGALYRNVNWFDLLDFEYDMSVPNVAHLDPQHGGCCTTFPYFIGKILEIPVTMTQDYSLFNILREYKLDLWEKQMSMIREKHGVMNFIVHPDYVIEEREQCVYGNLLRRLAELRESANVWVTVPDNLNKWWRQRSQMRLVKNDGGWMIVGDGKDRASVAYARMENGKLVYTF